METASNSQNTSYLTAVFFSAEGKNMPFRQLRHRQLRHRQLRVHDNNNLLLCFYTIFKYSKGIECYFSVLSAH
jgi:hypothetical protein